MGDAGGFREMREQLQVDQIEVHQSKNPVLVLPEATLREFQIVIRMRADQAHGMYEVHAQVVLVALTFIFAGAVKSVTGMGLPTVAIRLLVGLLMAPAEAAMLLVIPSLATNVW
jgi:hypothetical protein